MNDKEMEFQEEEEDVDMKNMNRNRDNEKKKKNIMYVIIGALVLVLILLICYIIFDKDELSDDEENNNEIVNGEIEQDDTDNLGYVSCDDNTSLLNVRNSTSGDIIDGLSCYKKVTIEEELEGTSVCDKWYRISYAKNDSSYTGYACGTYIKKYEVDDSVTNDVRVLIDKAIDYYDNSVLKAYCGNNKGTRTIDFGNGVTGEYVKSEYKDLDELKNYLLSFMDEKLIKSKFILSDFDNPKYNDDYYMIDDYLYCRNYDDSGWINYYTGNYDIEITNYSDNKINLNIAYQYIKEDSTCKLNELSKCNRNDFVYGIGKVTIMNNIITKMDFHK